MSDKSDDQQPQASSSDDAELAKVLAGINQQADDVANSDQSADDGTMPTPKGSKPPAPASDGVVQLPSADHSAPDGAASAPASSSPGPSSTASAPVTPTVDPALDNIKQRALGELRPLVDKLNVTPEEKFDTYLLLLRSTDDKNLIAPAHEAASSITDETRKAQALLDVIKEIDFLSQNKP
ncbi:hypothetical protein CR983_04210 [Candidatus Saccharibacteria bacterium]|nr:MAG: hypothetical protein CR983_04210 [Candidatus Saccharibacteria bacterium]